MASKHPFVRCSIPIAIFITTPENQVPVTGVDIQFKVEENVQQPIDLQYIVEVIPIRRNSLGDRYGALFRLYYEDCGGKADLVFQANVDCLRIYFVDKTFRISLILERGRLKSS